MKRPPITPIAAVLALLALLAGCVGPQPVAERPPPPRLMEWEEFKPAPGEIWIGGQPTDRALDEFAGRGGALVINLRTDNEIAYLPYYDHAITARGMKLVWIPTPGDGINAATQQALSHALAGHQGPVLLHCASGGRATYALALHRIATEGLTPEQAIAWAEAERGSPSERGEAQIRAFAAEIEQE